MNTTLDITQHRGGPLEHFSIAYSRVHGYISLTLCAIGIPLNIINVIVLTRPNMRTPINFILTWLAVSDVATMISYVPFAYYFYCKYSPMSMSSSKNNNVWMNFLLVHLNMSATTHTISIWLAVALAVFRHHHIHSPAKGNITRMRRLIRARLVVGIVVFSSVVVLIPNYLSHSLIETTFRDNTTGYVFEDWELVTGETDPTKTLALVFYSIIGKLTPCLLILIYGGLLLRTLNKNRRQRIRLSENGVNLFTRTSGDPSRTTLMLLTVMVMFVLTELPQGVLILCCIFVQNFFERVYIPLGDVMDILALINNSVNFVLYCTMSCNFRKTFVRLFCAFLPRLKRKVSLS